MTTTEELNYLLIATVNKANRCRLLFTSMVKKYNGNLNQKASEKYNMIIIFLILAERSYAAREHNLRKLTEEDVHDSLPR